jgi:hypothetical protein
LEYFSAIWYNLWPFGTVCGQLVYLSRFGMFGPRNIWQPCSKDIAHKFCRLGVRQSCLKSDLNKKWSFLKGVLGQKEKIGLRMHLSTYLGLKKDATSTLPALVLKSDV